MFVAEDASEDRHLVFAGMSRSSAHVHSSVCMVPLAYHIRCILPRLIRFAPPRFLTSESIHLQDLPGDRHTLLIEELR